MAQDYSKIATAELEKLDLAAHELDITSTGNEITVDGWVSSEDDKLKVLTTIRRIPDVDEVVDRIDVANRIALDDGQAVSLRLQEVQQASDTYMQNARLRGPYNFSYSLDQEGVLISGSAPAGFEPQALLYAIGRDVSTPVRQDIFVRPWPTDNELLVKLKSELQDKLGYNLDGLEISVNAGIVLLSGYKPTHKEIDQIASAILMVEGVRDLKSDTRYNQ